MAGNPFRTTGGRTSGVAGVAPGGKGLAVPGGRSVLTTRTVASADASPVTVSVTIPRSARATKAIATITAATSSLGVAALGQESDNTIVSPQIPGELDLSHLPESNTVALLIQQTGASTLQVVVGYESGMGT